MDYEFRYVVEGEVFEDGTNIFMTEPRLQVRCRFIGAYTSTVWSEWTYVPLIVIKPKYTNTGSSLRDFVETHPELIKQLEEAAKNAKD